MKKFVLSTLAVVLYAFCALAQTTILDFETPATSTVFQYFGSSIDGSFNEVINNPNPTGANTTAKVSKFVKPAVALEYAGCFSNPNPTAVVDLQANNRVSIMVHMDHIGTVSLKLEGSTNGGVDWAVTKPNTKINEWEEIVFESNLPSFEAPNGTATGFIYTRVTLFFDFGAVGTGTDVTSYFDEIKTLPAAQSQTTILDFETPTTNTVFQYFGSSIDGSFTEVVANPNPSGVNTSANVTEYVKPAAALVYAGAFTNPNPTTPIDLTSGGQVCVNVHMDHIGSVSLKFEGSTTGGSDWIQTVPNTVVNGWETLCFDASLPSIEAPNSPASGIYTRVVIFFDFGSVGTATDVTSYFDDIVVKSSSVPVARTVSFQVDMNSYTANFDKVYLSGTFNNWAGDANELTDANGDGIFEGSITVPNGVYEYKVTLDNWAAQEQFIGTEACTKTTGAFTNRQLLVSSDVVLPKFCFNSCYACGQEVKITFKLGMNGVTPNPDGVWIAGGGNFDVPGGRFKMNDADGDGIYELVVPRERSFGSFYTFVNGPCPDYSCKENLAGLPCGDPNNFNDRFLSPVTQDTVVATCFGACFTNAACVSGVNSPIVDSNLFRIMGNPTTSDFALLQFAENIGASKQVQLQNAMGRTIRQVEVAQGDSQFALSVADLPSGIYFITVRVEQRFLTLKLVK